MLTILEAILTFVAWRRGWRGLALLPLVILMLIGFMVGFVAGVAGFTHSQFNQLVVMLIPLELASLGVLIWMAARGRAKPDDKAQAVLHEANIANPL